VTRGIYTDCLLNYETVRYFEGRCMRHRGIWRLLGSIRVWRRGSFVSVSVSSHFKNYVFISQPPEPRTNARHHIRSSGRFFDRRIAHHEEIVIYSDIVMFITYYE
ncbi:uncharacterized protein BJ212DRAFT_1369972, partial [Suillus subaureus]